MKNIAPFIVLIAALAIIGIVLANWFSYRLKKQLLDTHPADESLLGLIRDLWKPGREALKWGLLLLSGGIGLIIDNFVPFDNDNSALGFGIEAVFLAGGFLTYYLFINKKNHER
ncbi:hypothetical protein [Mucilaginibacter sp. SJ]|uniref:hypothetical protein n=1 Tax=Mucilaginibacter sp. SJ TaxID=3029053 RepID=UPI0023A9A677|nr:hypothetical protein [Mucilaginibacter sp. SJ]WEA00549.1 hypothetical protein MusilaSJ_24135 [Mucilaginibacter sp. SJ]